jgi:hypothetical protein
MPHVRKYQGLGNAMFQKLELFPSSCEGPSTVGVPFPSPEDGKRSGFLNNVFPSYVEFQMLDEVHKSHDDDCSVLVMFHPCNSIETSFQTHA